MDSSSLSPTGRHSVKLAFILTAILVFTHNHFLLFTFVHCDLGHDHLEPLSGLHQANKQLKTGKNQRQNLSLSRMESDQRFEMVAPANVENVVTISDQRPTRSEFAGDPSNGRPSASSGKLMFARQLSRPKRLIRIKTPRVQLAQRPPKTTTTTSTTTSTTSTTTPTSRSSGGGGEPAEEDQEGDQEEETSAEIGDDYVEIKHNKPKKKVGKSSSTEPSSRSESKPDESQEGDEEEEEEQEEAATTTTTTTKRPATRKPTRKSNKPRPKSEDSSDNGPKKSGSKQVATSKQEVDSDKQRELTDESEPKPDNSNQTALQQHHHLKKKPLVALPFIRPKNLSVCIPEAYLEFPRDPIGDKWRGRGLVIIHVLIVCYMFYSLAVVCERYFMPSLEEFAQRLQISEDVAGATLMSAGSSAPELFTAILGVFVAKGDVGTGAIVGSAVFNILFVIGICAFVSSTSNQLQWWPVLRDSVYYTFTVLVLIIIIYDERITALESGIMILLYGLYIAIMAYNEQIKAHVTNCLLSNTTTAKLISSNSIQIDGPDDVFGGASSASSVSRQQQQFYEMNKLKTVEDDAIFMAAQLVIIKHKRLFKSTLRFQSAARYIIIKRQHRLQKQRSNTQEVNYFGPEEPILGRGGGGDAKGGSAAQRAKMEAYARSTTLSKQKFSIVSKDDYEFWHRPPEEGENYLLWLARIPVNYLLHYTIPDCTLYPDKYMITFVVSIIWTAIFSYLMVWMVTLIGYTLGIPDSVMGVTFLAAGTSVPDCYSSIHAARNGMADMAVSNSIGSNVFDILIGLSVPWFIQSAIFPGVVATINSRGVIYSVILLFLSLIVTIYLMNKYEWSLQPRLGLALLIAYGLFIIFTCMLEFNLLGHVNPPPCPAPVGNS